MSRRAQILGLKQRVENRLEGREPKRLRFQAQLGDHQGAVMTADSPMRVNVRRDGRAVIRNVLNLRVPIIPDLWVVVGYDETLPYELQVLTVMGQQFAWYGEGGEGGDDDPGTIYVVPGHHPTHEWRQDGSGGNDVVWIHKQQIINLMVAPPTTSGLYVDVYKGWYPYNNSMLYFETTRDALNTELTAAKGTLGTGEARWVGIYIDTSTDPHSLDTVNGSIFLATMVPFESEDWFPTWPANCIPLSAVYMRSDTDAVTGQNLWDMRAFPTGLAGTAPTPQYNLTATDAPDANDDADDGYEVSALWYDITHDRAYTCLDATAGAAIWIEITVPKGEFFLSAAGMWPSTTNGCDDAQKVEYGTNDIDIYVLDFSTGVDEYAQVTTVMPDDYDGNTITAQFRWLAPGGSGDVVWGLQGIAYVDNDAIDVAWGTAQTVTDTLTAVGDECVSAETSAITLAGSPTAGCRVQFRVSRKGTDGSDTLGAVARLIGVTIRYTRTTS